MGYLQHGRRHLPGGTDPVMFDVPTPTWEDITGDLAVSRVTGTDTDPDITGGATKALQFDIGGLAGLKVVKLVIQLGAGGPGSGTSQYLIAGTALGLQSLDTMYAGRGYIRKTSVANQPVYGCQVIGAGTNDLLILWDGTTTGIAMGPKASTGGAPFDFAAGDTIFNGLLFLQ